MAGDAKEMPSDLSEFCRVCLQLPQASQYLDLSTIYDEEDHLSYSDCFTICTQIDLKAGIGVPHHLCKSCGLELQMSYDFHKKVEESKRVIEKYEKKMQDRTNEQQLLYKPLPQKVVQKNQQQDTNEQELNDATTFFLSPMVVEGNNLPQSQKTLDLTQDEQEYLGSSDEENGVELLSKIGSIRDTVADDQENEHLVPMAECIEIEEHLEMEDFQNLETLEEEDYLLYTEHLVLKEEYLKRDLNIEETTGEHIPETLNVEEIDTENTINDTFTVIPILKPAVKLAMPGGPPFICGLCGHSSNTKAQLSIHRHRKHRHDTEIFQCDKCERHFNTKKQYEKHIKRPSCDKYPEYTCEYCSKKIIGLSNYNIHMRFHKKIYPFVCHLCNKGFMMTVHLKTHIQTRHENKRYICEEPSCGKFFKSTHSLKTHMYVHMDTMPFRCECCGKMFPNKGRLNWHLKKHHDLKLTLQELDRMLVGEVISIKAKVGTVKF